MSEYIELADAAKWLAGLAVPAFGWFLQRQMARVESDINSKANHAEMTREIARLEMKLQETIEARERDKLDIERASAERFNTFSETMRDRFGSLERNVDSQLKSMSSNFDNQLKMILHAIDGLRKE